MLRKSLLSLSIATLLTGCFDNDSTRSPVVESNSAPVISTIDDQIVKVDISQNVVVDAKDADNDKLIYSLVSGPAWATISAKGVITFSLVAVESETVYSVTVSVSDGRAVAEKTFAVIALPKGVEQPSSDAPIVEPLAQQVLVLDGNVSKEIQIVARDQQGEALTYRLDNAPVWASIDSSSGLITLQPGVENIGFHALAAIVTSNGAVARASQTAERAVSFGVFVTEASTDSEGDRAPEIAEITDLTIMESSTEVVRIKAFDPDGKVPYYALVDSPEWAAINGIGEITLSPDYEDVNTTPYPVTVRVSDGVMTSSKTFRVTVTPQEWTPVDPDTANHAPVIATILPQTVKADTSLSLRVEATDKNGDELTYELIAAPLWASINSVGQMTLAPSTDDVADHTLTVRVSDGSLANTATFSVKVTPIESLPVGPPSNTAPVIAPIGAQSVRADTRLEILVKATDAENDVLSYELVDSPAWASVTASGNIILTPDTGAVTLNGEGEPLEGKTPHPVTVRVSDGSLFNTLSFAVNVTPIVMTPVDPDVSNNAPVVTPVTAQTVQADETLRLVLQATDVQDDVLSYSLFNSPAWAEINAAGEITLKPATADVGNHTITARVSDGSLFGSAAFTVEVTPIVMTPVDPDAVNYRPEIAAISAQTVQADNVLKVQVDASDKNTDDQLTYALVNSPDWAVINDTGEIALTPTTKEVGSRFVTVSVSDGSLTVATMFDVEVTPIEQTPVDPANYAPVVEAIKDVTIHSGITMTIPVQATDANNDPLTYTLEPKLDWAVINATTGVITMTPPIDDSAVGSEGFTVRVSDGSLEGSVSFMATIKQAELSIIFAVDGANRFGSPVTCNGKAANQLVIQSGTTVSCDYKGLSLATFTEVRPDTARRSATGTPETTLLKRLELATADEFAGQADRLTNAQSLIRTFGTDRGDVLDLELTALDELKFKNHFGSDLNLSPEEFKAAITEDSTEANDGKLPSSHVPDVAPATTPGASGDLGGGFVSASAEDNYQYQGSDVVISTGTLTTSDGLPVAGIDYYTASSRGTTNSAGEFQFQWGEAISFGIDTFELGEARGNQTIFTLDQLAEGDRGLNAEAIVRRYATDASGYLEIADVVSKTFAQYPNVINSIINLSLSQDKILDMGNGNTQVVAGEFNSQFASGMAQTVDQEICPAGCTRNSSRSAPRVIRADESADVLKDVQRLWGATEEAMSEGYLPVEKFHVFHDSTWFYGITGNARGQAAINISNRAFPILMARNDKNYGIPFGVKKAWDANSMAYITEAPSAVEPEVMAGDTATFNLPFISVGSIGRGKLMMMGHPRYTSVLVCPNGYSWMASVNSSGACTLDSDPDDMKNFFKNTIRYLTGKSEGITVGTNIPHVYFARTGLLMGTIADFVIDPTFGVTATEQLSSFEGLDPESMPLLIVTGFEYMPHNNDIAYEIPLHADIENPKLTQDDITALINYISKGGNVLIAEAIEKEAKTTPLYRLLDAAGVAIRNGHSVVNTDAASPDGVRAQRTEDFWVLERYPTAPGEDGVVKTPYTIHEDGSVTWDFIENDKPQDEPALEVASWLESNAEGQSETHLAFVDTAGKSPEQIETEKARVLDAFRREDGSPAYEECKLEDFHYEINCLEFRKGNGIPVLKIKAVFTKLHLGDAESRAMIKAANLGSNIEALYQHELYYRTQGSIGHRLSSVDLKTTYQNMSIWLWNDVEYSYESDLDDELGFKRFTEILNCYTSDRSGGGTSCPEADKNTLNANNMRVNDGQGYDGYLNPSYPLNYMEKPLTRLMLGRSYYDYDVKVDIRQFPGEAKGSSSATVELDLSSKTTAWFAGNRQPTGQWAVAHQPFTVSVEGTRAPVTITVALHDDLVGLENHELGLKRPPRMTNTFNVTGSGTFTVPYGGLIYVKGSAGEAVSVTFTGTVNAPLYKFANGEGSWVNPQNSPAPIGELVSETFVYTAPKKNFEAANIEGGLDGFAHDLDTFSADLNDFYARDENYDSEGVNRKATLGNNPNSRHHFANDIQISIGAAHSGYPVMNGSFHAGSSHLSTNPLNDWLLWHEVGHNAAEAPFRQEGGTEVVNNILALYMQDKYLGKMARVEQDIRIIPTFVNANSGKAWALAGVGERLVMFAQLKEWAENEENFDIRNWYTGELPAFYSEADGMRGWNLFKLMHRLTRTQADPGIALKGGENLCYGQDLGDPDKLMVCASYATQTDLTGFFHAWNPGSRADITPGSVTPTISGGVTAAGTSKVTAAGYEQPQENPLDVDAITVITVGSDR